MTEETTESAGKWPTPVMKQFLAVSGVVMYMIGSGANIAYPAVLLQQLQLPGSAISLTTEDQSWIASILGLALICGIVTAPFSLQRLGRKLTNQLSTLPTMTGWILLAVAKGPTVLLASRFLIGFGMGIQAAAAPVSIAEYTDPKHRGAFLASIAFSFATGMLIAHVFGILFYWRQAALACGSFYAISLILVSLSPETPPFLASKGAYAACRASFHWLRGTNEAAEKELEALLNSQKNRIADTTNIHRRWKFYKEMFKKPEFYKPTLIMIFMFVLFQVSGMTVIPSYTNMIMAELTDGFMEPEVGMLLIDGVRFATAVLTCFVTNKLNRRTVLILGVTITVISLLSTSLLLFLRDGCDDCFPRHRKYDWLPLIPFLVYIFGKTLGILPIPWAIAGEIFPLAYRSVGSGISGAILSTMFFVVVKTAPLSFLQFGLKGTLIIYAISVAICGGFLFYLLPETKGKTLYEIECHFRGIKENEQEKPERVKMIELEKEKGDV